MRLIDVDNLIDDCKRYLATLNPDRDGKECTRIHWLIGVLNNAATVNPDTPTDCISRQAAIDAIKKSRFLVDAMEKVIKLPSAQPDLNEWCTDCKEYDKENHSCPRFNRVIREAVKDAQQERKIGKWSVYDRHTIPYQYICSECGVYHRARYDFCPSCGADMRGEA